MALRMDQAADGVWLVTGTDNNWVLVADGDEVTLVDAGFPGDLPRVLASVERIGRAPGDVRAIVLTHAHPDHLGGSERLRADDPCPIGQIPSHQPATAGPAPERVICVLNRDTPRIPQTMSIRPLFAHPLER